MSMAIADWSLLLSLGALMFIFMVKLYRVMSVMDTTKQKKRGKQVPYDFRFFVIEIVGVLFMWALNYASMSVLLTLFSSWMFKIATFLMALSCFFFVAELLLLGKETTN